MQQPSPDETQNGCWNRSVTDTVPGDTESDVFDSPRRRQDHSAHRPIAGLSRIHRERNPPPHTTRRPSTSAMKLTIVMALMFLLRVQSKGSLLGNSIWVCPRGGHTADGPSGDSPSHPYSLGIRDSIMVAHSFRGKEFGPAQALHGATYTVDVDLLAQGLAPNVNWVVDIGEFSTMLGEVLAAYNFKNLDDLFPRENTTTEFMCRAIHNDLAARLGSTRGGMQLRVKLHESHKAWAAYSATI